jgi:ACS family tartrate transporter-like MFS transporter
MESEIGRRTVAKVAWRLIPLLFVCYIVAFLDRVNVGYAALQMNEDLGFSAAVYGLGAGIFFIGYFLFEVPSNLIMERVGARIWIARIMITWGILASAMALVQGPTSFFVLRFLLGFAEAGFVPGIVLYLTYWFPMRERARTTAMFFAAVPVAGVIGSPLSGWLLTLDGLFGLAGWQVMFIVEGIPAVLLGLIVLAYLPDRPEQARWLEPAEGVWLNGVLAGEEGARAIHGRHTLRHALRSGKVWLLSAICFGFVMSLYGVSLWLPLIIEEFSGLGPLGVGLLGAIPYVAAAVGMVLFARHSDATGERRWHLATATFVAAIGLVLTGVVDSPVLQMAVLSVVALGIFSCLGSFWALPTAFLSGTAAAGGIALINSIGNLGGFVGPFAVGYVRETTGSYYGGMLLLAALIFSAGILTLAAKFERSDEQVEEVEDIDTAPVR